MQDVFTFESRITKEEKGRILNDVRRYSVLRPVRSMGAIFGDYLLIAAAVFAAVHFASDLRDLDVHHDKTQSSTG